METLHTAIMVTGVPKKEHCGTETNYVDLGSTSTVKFTVSGEGNQQAKSEHKGNLEENEEGRTDQRKDGKDSSSYISDTDLKIEHFLDKESDVTGHEPEEMHDYADMYLNSRCESESESELEDGDPDESQQDMPVAEETEAHYITTHEIQLTELDHNMDHELGRAASSCWDYDNDNLVYSFVDYASFKSGEQPIGERGQRRATSSRPPKLGSTKPLISTESDCASSDDGARNTEGRIHLSVKASSQTVSEYVRPSRNNNNLLHCYHEPQAKIEVPYNSQSHCFIPAPGRQHLASKLMKGKDVTEYSSGGSSSVSELDDADKEVRNLTAKSFRSIGFPYFDTIDLRPSSESSVSEQSLGMNKWSSLVDFNYRNYMSQGAVIDEHKNSICSVEMRKHTGTGSVNVNTVTEGRTQQINTTASLSNSTQLSCDTERHMNYIQNVSNSPESTSSKQGDVDVEGAQTKAVLASSLLQNVLSKKIQFGQEQKVDHGQVNGVQHEHSPTKHTSCTGLQRQAPESGSGHSIVSEEDHMDSTKVTFSKFEEDEKEEACKTSHIPSKENISEIQKPPLLEDCGISENIGGSMGHNVHVLSDVTATLEVIKETEEAHAEATDTRYTATKMSHLYVPRSHFLSKDRDLVTPLKQMTDPIQSDRKTTSTVDTSNSSKTPEITIRLHSMNENKNDSQRPFNIARLLTPNLSKPTGDAKSEKVPHFMVRDVRDSRCKLQTPIHQVRDVRKLVKSSYRLVSVESGENKIASHKESNAVKKEPDKTEKTPMVIKWHSVNTNRRNNPESERLLPMQQIAEQQEIQMKSTSWKESCDKRVECKMSNQVALEKLKAAVKTMEQLYVFDRNEWRRKTEAPRPVKDSHVLSLITSEEQGADTERLAKTEPSKTRGADTRTISHHMQQDDPIIQCPSVHSNPCSNPLSLKVYPKNTTEKRNRVESEAGRKAVSATFDSEPKSQPPSISDSENYLTIPNKSRPLETIKSNTSEQILAPAPQPHPQPRPPLQRSPVVTESWSPESPTTLTYCQPAQVLCVTPPMDTLTSNTQRKLLMDPITGQCYLVDTPIALQPITQRLYCPESAQYLDVPVAMSPATYLFYPPFVQPQSPPISSQGENTSPGASITVSEAKPVISITSQQGPHIVAQPSFDGRTMSFVVEHR